MSDLIFQIYPDHQNRLLRVNCQGMLQLRGAVAMVCQARDTAARLGYPLVYDFRELALPEPAPVALALTFPLIAGLAELPSSRNLRSVAIVATGQLGHPLWDSYRLASRQRGMHWNYFDSEQGALHWLSDRNHWDIRRHPPSSA